MLQELYQMSACPRVVDISRRKPPGEAAVTSGQAAITSGQSAVTQRGSPMSQLVNSTADLARLQSNTAELQVRVMNLLAATRPGGQIRSDFSAFPTPHFAKVYQLL